MHAAPGLHRFTPLYARNASAAHRAATNRRRHSIEQSRWMQEHEEVEVDKPLDGPHGFRHKVVLPQRVGMDLQELVPGSFDGLLTR